MDSENKPARQEIVQDGNKQIPFMYQYSKSPYLGKIAFLVFKRRSG